MNKEEFMTFIQKEIDNKKDIHDVFYIMGLIDIADMLELITRAEGRQLKEKLK